MTTTLFESALAAGLTIAIYCFTVAAFRLGRFYVRRWRCDYEKSQLPRLSLNAIARMRREQDQ